MSDELQLLPSDHLFDLQSWTNAWYAQAVEEGFIHGPYRPDEVTVKRLHGYFRAGLTPDEAAQACFCLKH